MNYEKEKRKIGNASEKTTKPHERRNEKKERRKKK